MRLFQGVYWNVMSVQGSPLVFVEEQSVNASNFHFNLNFLKETLENFNLSTAYI